MARCCRTILGAAALVLASSAITTTVMSQSQKQDPKQAPPGAAEMEAWLKLAAPGPEHARLMKSAGKWTQKNTHWMYPGAEGQVATATATMEPILGGRFLLEKVKSRMDMGGGQMMDFEGLGIFGYDNGTKKHVFAWVDNMGTMIMTAEGTADATGKVVTYLSKFPDPMTGGTAELKTVATDTGADSHKVEMFMKQPDGTWFRNMEILGTRQK
jgi:hypothetical protein